MLIYQLGLALEPPPKVLMRQVLVATTRTFGNGKPAQALSFHESYAWLEA